MLDAKLTEELKQLYQRLTNEGSLLSREQLAGYYATFRSRFGPERLLSLDGEALLSAMHEHGSRESLVYWLEFKDDDEFPTRFSGSIAGGSSLKFGIYRRRETGAWMTGAPKRQRELTTGEAVEIARRHRDQLVKAAEFLVALPVHADDAAYMQLQADLDREAPDASPTAWGHKYLSLLFPEKLDVYHAESYQRFHLIKLLQDPPAGAGRYLCAGRYVALADELGIPLNHLHSLLNSRDPQPYRYWRILVNYQDKGRQHRWEPMLRGGYVAVGWRELGDLTGIEHNQEGKNRVLSLMKEKHGDKGSWGQELFSFVAGIEPGDLVLAFEKNTVLGIGRVTGDHRYEPDSEDAPNRRAVEWLSTERWDIPQLESEVRVIRELRLPANQIAIERHLLSGVVQPKPVTPQPRLEGIPGRIQAILERKGQVILYGPPGTGKTYWARLAARDLAALGAFSRLYAELDAPQKAEVEGNGSRAGLVRFCTFHPAYGYEDFIEGYRPHETGAGQLAFELRPGLFRQLCADAAQQPKRKFYLIIDEINRGDIPRIFGELLTLLERDKRGQAVHLPLSGQSFSVPPNVYVIGTMNTADRSIALLDKALRRRFGFIELLPDITVLGQVVVGDRIPLGPWLEALNTRILEHIGRDARNLQIGHSYLLDENGRPVANFESFVRILKEDIFPLLQEYCYEDYGTLVSILGERLVDVAGQRVCEELLSPARREELVQALWSPSIAISPQALVRKPEPGAEEEDPATEGSEA